MWETGIVFLLLTALDSAIELRGWRWIRLCVCALICRLDDSHRSVSRGAPGIQSSQQYNGWDQAEAHEGVSSIFMCYQCAGKEYGFEKLQSTANKTPKSHQQKEMDGKVFTDLPTHLQRGRKLTLTSDCLLVSCTITDIIPGSSLPSLLSVSPWISLSLLAQHMPINHLQTYTLPPHLLPHPHFILAWNEKWMSLFPMVIWCFKPNKIAAVGWDFQMRQRNLHGQFPLKLTVYLFSALLYL